MLSHLPKGFTAVVSGANGGIGSAIIKALLSSGQVGEIIATSRSPLTLNHPRLKALTADVTTEYGRSLDGRTSYPLAIQCDRHPA